MGYEELTEKQKRFIDYYIETGNQTEAAKRAGYKQPHVQGNQNLEKLSIFIKEKLDKKDKERIASQDEVLEYLTRVMRGEEKDQFDLDASLQDRTKCAELLGKRYATFTDKVDTDANINFNITIDYGEDENEKDNSTE